VLPCGIGSELKWLNPECSNVYLNLISGPKRPRERNFKTMPNPKRRHSQKRTSTRRAHDALKAHSLSECPNCHEKKMPHRACPKCGYYKGREVLDVEEAS